MVGRDLGLPMSHIDFGEECTHVPLMCDSISAISVAKKSSASFQIA
jgi:hypothetical protein